MNIKWEGCTSVFSLMLKDIWNESECTDVALVGENANGQEIMAHKVILASLSPLFRKLLIQDGIDSETNSTPFHIKGIRHCDQHSLLLLIYHGQVDIPKNQVEGFIEASEAFAINGLSGFEEVGQNEKFIDSSEKKKENKLSYFTNECTIVPLVDSHHGKEERVLKFGVNEHKAVDCKIGMNEKEEVTQSCIDKNDIKSIYTIDDNLNDALELPDSSLKSIVDGKKN